MDVEMSLRPGSSLPAVDLHTRSSSRNFAVDLDDLEAAAAAVKHDDPEHPSCREFNREAPKWWLGMYTREPTGWWQYNLQNGDWSGVEFKFTEARERREHVFDFASFSGQNDGDAQMLRDILKDCTHFRLSISSCALYRRYCGVTLVEPLVKLLQEGKNAMPYLETLKITNLAKEVLQKVVDPLAVYLKRFGGRTLQNLDFSYNPDLEQGHLVLAQVLKSGELRLLESLSLRFSNILDGKFCKAYEEALSHSGLPELKNLDLAGNKLGDKGAAILGRAFSSGHLSGLVTIDVSQNRIRDAGLISLAESFTAVKFTELRELNFNGNLFTSSGLSKLSSALASGNLNSLQLLWLEGALVTGSETTVDQSEECHKVLLEALSSNESLTADIQTSWHHFPELDRSRAHLLERNRKQLLERNRKHVMILAHLERTRRYVQTFPQLERTIKHVQILAHLMEGTKVSATFGKVYLCGNSEAGKTSLRKALMRGFLESLCISETKQSEEKLTKGIAVSHLIGRGRKGISLAIWDMAGQVDNHLLHGTFFPDQASVEGKASTFVIVGSSDISSVDLGKKKSKVLEDFDYWLRFIASSCKKSSKRDPARDVFIVLNRKKKDEDLCSAISKEWQSALKRWRNQFDGYLNINDNVHIVDCRKRRNVGLLKQRLIQTTSERLAEKFIPEICLVIRSNLAAWSQEREHFPALHWDEFVEKVRSTEMVWEESTIRTATIYLHEIGVLIFADIDTQFTCSRSSTPTGSESNSGAPPESPDGRLVVLDPSWVCQNIVGYLLDPLPAGEVYFRNRVDASGSITMAGLKAYLRSLNQLGGRGGNSDWDDSAVYDLVSLLLWLGLCFRGQENNVFFPALSARGGRPAEDCWGPAAHSEGHWVMGFTVEHMESEHALVPIALWHRFQVALAQNAMYNVAPENDFEARRYFVTFKVRNQAVWIEAKPGVRLPTLASVSVFVRPIGPFILSDSKFESDALQRLQDAAELDKRRQSQVDLASDIVEALLKLWDKFCPGVTPVQRVVWPWPASGSRPNMDDPAVQEELGQRNEKVEDVRRWVQENGLGRKLDQWTVGLDPISKDQLLSTKDKLIAT